MRTRAAQKRPLATDEAGVSEGDASDDNSLDDEWQSSPAPSAEESTETTTSMSEGSGQTLVVARRLKNRVFSSCETLVVNAWVKVMDSASNTFAVKMTKWNLQHNHSLTEYGFRQHPSNRMKIDEKTMQTGDQLRQAGAKKSSNLKFITDNSESNPTLQDVHNLVRKLKLRDDRHGPSNSGKRFKRWMIEFGEQPRNVDRIFIDEHRVGEVWRDGTDDNKGSENVIEADLSERRS
ncbi:hypothetical protein GQ600_7107 [Phytophthora cactorum]|nr:hypothetical protein GQ600_7107 [Phytophthora cactorum]